MSEDRGDGAAEIGFSEAMRELEAILGRIEAEETDIDGLARELERAAELLELCRERIRKAEVEVTQIVQGIETSPPAPAGDEEEGD